VGSREKGKEEHKVEVSEISAEQGEGALFGCNHGSMIMLRTSFFVLTK
jgi:hypothetical protein